MQTDSLTLIEEETLTRAWARAIQGVLKPGVKEISPLVVSVTGFEEGQPLEDPEIRAILDSLLIARHKSNCHTVANTIFPISLWNRGEDRQKLFARFMRIWPKIRKTPANRNGVYFQRLIGFGPSEVNQLDHIITTYKDKENHRLSALQAAIFDPEHDHTNQLQRGFPCLQHVIFTPHEGGTLDVTGFYAKQYLVEKAYGNYLGLCRLGYFMAQEMGLHLTRMICIASVACVGKINKTDADIQHLAKTLASLKVTI